MPKNKTILVFTLLGGGLILVGLSIYFSFFAKKQLNDSVALAQVERELGKSYVYSSGFSRREAVTDSRDIFNQESVETLETGEVKISFANGYVLNLESNSMLTLERNSDTNETLVTLTRGSLTVEKIGREPLFYILQNGKKILARDYVQQKLADSSPAAYVKPLETNNTSSQLSEEEIHTLLNGQRSSFFKCYAQLLQNSPESKGMISLNFIIEPSGKIQQASVDSKDLPDKNFQKCLVEILKRLEFRSFAGPSISTLFPMKFE